MNEKKCCETCGQTISWRKISLYRGLLNTLWRVYKWAEKNNHEFTRKEIKHLFQDENDTARFGDLIMFGGLVYRPEGKERGYYGLNMNRCDDFFAKKYQIPLDIWKDPVTGNLQKENYVTIDEIPSLMHYLNDQEQYIVEYAHPNSTRIKPQQGKLL